MSRKTNDFDLLKIGDGSAYVLTYGKAGWIRFPAQRLDDLHQLITTAIARRNFEPLIPPR